MVATGSPERQPSRKRRGAPQRNKPKQNKRETLVCHFSKPRVTPDGRSCYRLEEQVRAVQPAAARNEELGGQGASQGPKSGTIFPSRRATGRGVRVQWTVPTKSLLVAWAKARYLCGLSPDSLDGGSCCVDAEEARRCLPCALLSIAGPSPMLVPFRVVSVSKPRCNLPGIGQSSSITRVLRRRELQLELGWLGRLLSPEARRLALNRPPTPSIAPRESGREQGPSRRRRFNGRRCWFLFIWSLAFPFQLLYY